MPPPLPRFTVEYCESLLRNNPAATARLYHRVQKELKEMEATESVHRWDVRAALLDGPKTAQQCANWARERGNKNIDRPLADNILRNLVRAEEVGIDVSVLAGKPPVFVATPAIKHPPAEQTAPAAAEPVKVAALSSLPEVGDIADRCATLPKGEALTFVVPSGEDPSGFAQRVRLAMGNRKASRESHWSVVRLNFPNRIVVTNRGLRLGEALPQQQPGKFLASPEEIERSEKPLSAPSQTVEVPGPAAGRWEAGRGALAELNAKIRHFLELREALERVIPMMEKPL